MGLILSDTRNSLNLKNTKIDRLPSHWDSHRSFGRMLSGKHTEVTKNRISNFTDSGKSEVNLRSKLYKHKTPLLSLKSHSPPKQNDGRITFEEASKAHYVDASIGTSFGPSW